MNSMQSAVTLDENIALTESEWLSMKKRTSKRPTLPISSPWQRQEANADYVNIPSPARQPESRSRDSGAGRVTAPDKVEVAVSFCWQCGSLLLDVSPQKLKEILAEFSILLRKGELEKRTRFLIVRLLAAYKQKFRDSATARVFEAWDGEYQVTHYVSLYCRVLILRPVLIDFTPIQMVMRKMRLLQSHPHVRGKHLIKSN
ncbi:hypothetical protein SASPL_116778 [Salvia splendens]|uniref:Uncharacterized protein n=1 Tax=Salvia splendens TaxID=180675 RepID=A0A8X8XZC1_SALSN|nr:hypothetical protein SASPL_116778 [Salvia splendens]